MQFLTSALTKMRIITALKITVHLKGATCKIWPEFKGGFEIILGSISPEQPATAAHYTIFGCSFSSVNRGVRGPVSWLESAWTTTLDLGGPLNSLP